jgi:hypothetical protein
MGQLEKEIEAGITYMPDNRPETIARTLERVVQQDLWRNTAGPAVQGIYGPEILREALDKWLCRSAGKN